MARFLDVFDDVTKKGTKLPSAQYKENGRYPIIDQGQSDIAGYADLTEGVYADVPAIIFGDHTRVIKYVDTPCFLGADGVKLLKCKIPNADTRYLYYALKSVHIPNTGYNRHFKWLKESDLPIPPVTQQRQIAATLDCVDRMISLRKLQLEKLDELVKSRFVEMFGDSVQNPMGWETMTFREASLRLSDGPFGSNLKSEHYTDAGIRVIRLGNIGVGRFIDDDQSYISLEHYEKLKKYTCYPGDVVIGTLGEPNLRACLVPNEIKMAINKADCVHYVPRPDLLRNSFVCQYINCPETLSLAAQYAHGQTRTRISSGQIAKMRIFVPPMALQQSFADFVAQTDKSKLAISRCLEKAEYLKSALMQEYFG